MSDIWTVGARPIVRVFIVEARRAALDALTLIFGLDKHLEIVGTSATLDPELLTNLRPDVVFLDYDALTVSIEEAIVVCELAFPSSRICVLSYRQRTSVMRRVLGARASAYIVKDTPPWTLVAIAHAAARGEYYADPRLAGNLLRRGIHRAGSSAALSRRELEVIRYIAEGMSNREIGLRTSLSEKTVKNHVSQILAKLKLPARTGVAVYALRNGLIK